MAVYDLSEAADHISEGYRLSIFKAHSIYDRITDNGVFIVRLLGREDIAKELSCL